MLPSLARRNTILVQVSHYCRRFLFFSGNSSLSLASCLVVRQPYDEETDICLQPYNPFHFYIIGTQAGANIHKAFACRYLSKNICTVVEEWWHHSYFCLGYFSSSTHFDLVRRMARKVWRQCVLVFAHDRYSHAGNCIGLLSNTGQFHSTGNKYPFLLQRRFVPSDS